ncbi:MAG TPA: hypothetical protein VFL27_01625 [Candidatus Dormibacteraeota bacterium]|nr:hypothetical protein [Candidatus Dormibacteraeota bacterium]
MALSDLVTCIVQRGRKGWDVTYASEGRTPRDFSDASLAAAIERASAEVASLYSGKPEAASAELQFAIYPWRGDAGKVILDVAEQPDGLKLRDIQGTGIEFQSQSIEAAIADAERYLPGTDGAMVRWIRPVAGLTPRQ